MIDRLTVGELRFTPPALPEAELQSFLQSRWGLGGAFKALSGERDQNLQLITEDGRRFVCKVSSPLENTLLVDFQTRALQHIERADPGLKVPRLVDSLGGEPMERLQSADGETYTVRLLSWVDGVPIGTMPAPSPRAVRRMGVLQGRLARAMQGFSHPAEHHFMPWDTMNGLILFPELRESYLPAGLAAACRGVLERWEHRVLPALRALPTQVIHNDSHTGNVMCNPDDPDEVTGVIDFGDLIRRPLVIDLSTSLTSLVERATDVVAVSATLLEGYREHQELPEGQLNFLLDTMLARAILTVQLLSFRVAHAGDSDREAEVDLPPAILGLERLLAVNRERFTRSVAEFALT